MSNKKIEKPKLTVMQKHKEKREHAKKLKEIEIKHKQKLTAKEIKDAKTIKKETIKTTKEFE